MTPDTFPAWWTVRPRVVEPPARITVPPRDPRYCLPPLLRFIFYGERNPHPDGTFAWRCWEEEQRERRWSREW